MAVSSISMFELKMDQGLASCNPGKNPNVCTSTFKFSMFNRQPCSYTFVCPSLKGNICGEYGISVTDTTLGSAEVCYEGAALKGVLNPGDGLDVSLWFLKASAAAAFKVECYFWCTASVANTGGALIPEGSVGEIASNQFLQFFVSQ